MSTVETKRLIIRPPVANDRDRLVALFTDAAFTVFSAGVHDLTSANLRFDRMSDLADSIPYAKQPIVEKSTGLIVGYTGVGTIDFDGVDQLEWGWRLTPEARGMGYATEATSALLKIADATTDGEVLCIIATENLPSRSVADKLGFRWDRQVTWPDGMLTDLLLRPIGNGGPRLLAPG